MKQTLDHQGDPLLDNTDGNMQPQFLPGNRPRAQKVGTYPVYLAIKAIRSEAWTGIGQLYLATRATKSVGISVLDRLTQL